MPPNLADLHESRARAEQLLRQAPAADQVLDLRRALQSLLDAIAADELHSAPPPADSAEVGRAPAYTERLLAILDEERDIIASAYPDGRVFYMNRSGRELLGIGEREDIAGTWITDYHSPHVAEFLQSDALPGCMRDGFWRGELLIRRRDGSEFPVLQSLIAHYQSDGALYQISMIARDLTDLERTIAALDREHLRLRSLFQAIPDLIWLQDADGSYLACNPSFERYIGVSEADLFGKTDRDLLEIGLSQGLATRFAPHTQPQIVEEWLTFTETGYEGLFEITITPISGAAGQRVGVIGIAREITAVATAQQALRDSEERYRTLVETSPDGVGLFGIDGIIQYANRRLTAMLKATDPAELVGESIFRFVPAEDRPQARQRFEILLQAGQSQQEAELEAIDGSRFTGDIHIALIRDSVGHPVAFIGQIHDITDRALAQAAALQERQHFLDLFEKSPVATWLEDFSVLQAWMDQLRSAGVTDLRSYLTDRPALVREAFALVRVLDLNHAAVTQNGATSKADLLQNLHRLFANATHQNLIDELDAIWRGEPHFELELHGNRLDSQPQVLILNIDTPLKQGQLDLTRVIVTSIDITQRDRTEQALRESEERFQLAMEASNEGLWEWDRSTGRMTYSPAFFSLLGYAATIPEGTPEQPFWMEWVDPEQREMVRAAHSAAIMGERDDLDLEFRMLHADGGWRWFISRGRVLARDAERRATRMIGTNIEITARKATDQALRQRTQDLEALYAISTALRDAKSADAILEAILDQLHLVLSTDAGLITLIDPHAEEFRVVKADGVLSSNVGRRFPISEGVSGRVLRDRRPVVIPDMSAEQGLILNIVVSEQIGPAIFAPLVSGSEMLGTLAAERRRGAAQFTSDEVRMLVAIGEMVGIALQRAQLADQALERLERMQALHQIDLAITTSLDLRLTLDIVLGEALTQLRADTASVLLFNPSTHLLSYAAGRGFYGTSVERLKLRLGEAFGGQVALERRTLAVTNIYEARGLRRRDVFEAEGLTSYHGAPMISKGQVIGVLEVMHRAPFVATSEWVGFLEAVATQAAIAIDNVHLFERLQRANLELFQAYDATIEGWSRALDLRDKETEGHSERVTDLTIRLGQVLGMSDEALVHVRRGALLHDIGKMGIPDQILLKPGALTEDEWEVMRRHPGYAFDLLAPIAYLQPALDIPYCHHERWDGTGYPRGISGAQIPLAARIFAVIDVWDALTNARPYRPAWTKDHTLAYIREQSGTHFDPAVVEAFVELFSDMLWEASD